METETIGTVCIQYGPYPIHYSIWTIFQKNHFYCSYISYWSAVIDFLCTNTSIHIQYSPLIFHAGKKLNSIQNKINGLYRFTLLKLIIHSVGTSSRYSTNYFCTEISFSFPLYSFTHKLQLECTIKGIANYTCHMCIGLKFLVIDLTLNYLTSTILQRWKARRLLCNQNSSVYSKKHITMDGPLHTYVRICCVCYWFPQ